MDVVFPKKLQGAWESVSARHDARPSIGVILGSGLGAFAEECGGASIPFSAVKGFPTPTVAGHAGILKLGTSVAVMAGRIHYYEGHSLDDVVLPVFLLHSLGVRTLIITNAAGGINRDFAPGDLVLIRDHVNFQGVNPLRGPDPGLGPRFPDMSTTYTPALREMARSVSTPPLREGVYAAFTGPTYETPAEIRMLATIGVDMVGMSTVPEVIAAAYLGMKVLGISCITNMAAGILPQPLDHSEVIRAGKEAAPRFTRLLEETIHRLGGRLGDG